jgi:DNA polymerase (family 10)
MAHTLRNSDVADLFAEIADLLEITGANPFRSRAYRNAALTVRDYGPDLGTLLRSGEPLPKLPGIGEDLRAKLHAAFTTGHVALLDELHAQVPPGLTGLLTLPGLGPKRVKLLWRELGVTTPEALREACAAGRVKEVHGLGPKTEARLLAALGAAEPPARRFLLADARERAADLLQFLRQLPGVTAAQAAGSLRRGAETVGDLDLVATAADRAAAIAAFVKHPAVTAVQGAGETRATVRLTTGLQVDLRIVAPESYGAALHYFTGSKAHNVALRARALARGLKLNEYGLFRGEARLAGRTEDEVYAALGLPFIAPELRENRGELEAALAGALPRLVARGDLRGDLHCHTAASDGRDTLEAMVAAARAAGLTYLAVTDHSASSRAAHGLDERALRTQLERIDALNATLSGFTVLKGAEVDIREDGSLDYPDAVLAQLDLVIASPHGPPASTKAKQTRRLERAMDNRYVALVAHPTGRRLLERDGAPLDLERVIRHARNRGCALELNAHPLRLDLNDRACRLAKNAGVPIAIDTDAHGAASFAHLELGVAQARRAWLTPADVLNTRPLAELRAWLLALRS